MDKLISGKVYLPSPFRIVERVIVVSESESVKVSDCAVVVKTLAVRGAKQSLRSRDIRPLDIAPHSYSCKPLGTVAADCRLVPRRNSYSEIAYLSVSVCGYWLDTSEPPRNRLTCSER